MENKYEFNKYCTDSENLKKTLDNYGVAIIPSILNDIECNQMQNGAWSYLEHITQNMGNPIKKNNAPATNP